MKLYAQVGHQLGDKVTDGLNEKLIDGAIFSPKDLQKITVQSRIDGLRKSFPDAEFLIDPQFYVSLYADASGIKLGKIQDWDYFRIYRKNDLELSRNIDKILDNYFNEISQFNVTGVISPNIYISQSFDSREAVIAKNFIRQTRAAHERAGMKVPLFASIVICREALQNYKEFEEFINDLTVIENPPDGYYVIIGSRSSEARSDIYSRDILANWMMLNYSLSINGFKVINGYSDIITPFLGAIGAYAGASGWWSNLRTFSMERYFPSSGGQQPIIRYLSKVLLNRVTFSEKDALSGMLPDIFNKLPHDKDYAPVPERSAEVLQSWEAIKSLNEDMAGENIEECLKKCENTIINTERAYSQIAKTGFPLDKKSNDDHVEPLREAIRQFKVKTEL